MGFLPWPENAHATAKYSEKQGIPFHDVSLLHDSFAPEGRFRPCVYVYVLQAAASIVLDQVPSPGA